MVSPPLVATKCLSDSRAQVAGIKLPVYEKGLCFLFSLGNHLYNTQNFCKCLM
ncbi:unnamed protein product [Staurois parvus]|uniref:Uncharacterized protein n=1 Tax=Staurois parvus TaxID=386267 RepID=A0ABN9B7H2_9NEOB|nr:unnamed protein product [Staurois parvus]